MATLVLEAKSISKAFGRNRVLKGVDLELSEGEVYVLFGPNGAGKTTLVKVLCGLLKPDSGTVRYRGQDLGGDAAEVRSRVGMLTHEPYLYGELTAIENLEFFAQLYGVRDRRERSVRLLKEVGLYSRAHDRVSQFSRGMRQRLGLARAVLHGPDLVLLDEPYAGLDLGAVGTLDRVIMEGVEEGKTFLAITHDLERGLAIAQRAGILVGGRIVHESATPDSEDFRSRYGNALGGGA